MGPDVNTTISVIGDEEKYENAVSREVARHNALMWAARVSQYLNKNNFSAEFNPEEKKTIGDCIDESKSRIEELCSEESLPVEKFNGQLLYLH